MRHDARNTAILNEIHPSLRYIILLIIDKLEDRGEDIMLYEGFRSNAEQQIEWQKGRDADGNVIGKTVTNAKPGQSLHNYGLAVDFAPVGPLGIELSKRTKLEWTAIGRYADIAELAKQHGLEWGGDWPQVDRPHLQLTDGLTLAQIRNGKRPDAEKARQELLSHYRYKIENAKKGRKFADAGRKIELSAFIARYSRKIEEIG